MHKIKYALLEQKLLFKTYRGISPVSTLFLTFLLCILVYLFTLGQRDTLVYLHNIQACYVRDPFFNKHARVSKNTSIPKIFFPFKKQYNLDFQEKYPGTPLQTYNRSNLGPVVNWFRIHHEYLANTYFAHRLFHDERISTTDYSDAHLCFPTCHAENLDVPSANSVVLHVKPGSEDIFMGCNTLTIGIETLSSICSFAVPYWHSIYFPESYNIVPWKLGVKRDNFLCFVGGTTRGYHRDQVLRELKNAGQSLFADFTKKDSNEWTITTPPYEEIWDMYTRCEFSWQPEGDTVTRRAFYDSWMLGSIPVISNSAACTYRGLFGGSIFTSPMSPLEDIVIVLQDSTMMNGQAILRCLLAIDPVEVSERRKKMADLAPLLQWGWSESGNHSDALIQALTVFTSKF